MVPLKAVKGACISTLDIGSPGNNGFLKAYPRF
jgi:hypothetical protein